MGSLTTCLKKTRAGLAPGDEDTIVNRAAELRDGGMKASEAGLKATRDLLTEAIGERNALRPAAAPADEKAEQEPQPASAAVLLAPAKAVLSDADGENQWRIDDDVMDGPDSNTVIVTVRANQLSEARKSVTLAELRQRVADDEAYRMRMRRDGEQRAADARKAAIESRRVERETERSIFRDLMANPEVVGMSEKNVAVLVDAKAGDKVGPGKRALLARAIHKEAAKKAADLAKQKHRDPAVFGAALGAAKEQANIPNDAAMQTAFALGWTHALQGKTKSTLTGDNLNVRVHGYDAAREWMQAEEGAAWYEGRPVNKLQNTGLDLRRWYEQMREQMKAGESDIKKAWKQIERATNRADLFSPLLPDGVTPGYRLYVTEVRDQVRPFKAWLEAAYRWVGAVAVRGKYASSDKSNIDFMLEGRRQPSTYQHNGKTVTQAENDSFETDEAYRAQWLRTRAEEYLEQVRGITAVIEGTSSVGEAAQKWHERFVREFSDKRWNLDPSMLTASGQALVSSRNGIDAWAGETSDVMQLSHQSAWSKNLIANEKTVELPDKATPLVPPRLDRVSRDGGPDYRKGENVTPEQFKATFGMADVGFGQWVGAKEDQDHLNYSFDAFNDLAKHFGTDAKNLGFGGQLHFTIGALGHGKHAAHFSPNQPSPIGPVQVINVTNTKGDGTVYHEWVHALDHFMGGQWRAVRGRLLDILQHGILTPEKVDARARQFLTGGWYFKGNKNLDKVDAAMLGLRRWDRAESAYKVNADQLGKDYWGNEKELIARAAESWAFDTLPHASTYLVNAWVADGKVTQAAGYRGTPYPTGQERKQFNQALAALAKATTWENGRPTVGLAAFEAALPDEFKAGARRMEELSKRDVMQAYYDQVLAETADKAAADAQAKADAAAAEQRRLDELAEQKLKDLQPPPVVDAPPPSSAQGPLSDQELSDLFDQAAAELREEAQEQPDVPPPGAPAEDRDRWTAEDWAEIHRLLAKGTPVLLSEAGHGIPTIHEFGRAGQTDMVGFGVFKTVGDGWTASWEGGGAMDRTPSGKAYTTVQFSGGAVPAAAYDLQAATDAALANRRAADAPANQETPVATKNSQATSREDADPTARDLIAEAAKLGVKGADQALTGLAKLFGSKAGRLNSFPAGFDEEAYNEAKPHFKAALKAFQEAGKTLKDLFKLLIQQLGDGIKPYAMQFAKDEALGNNLEQQQADAPAGSPSMALARDIERHLMHVATPMEWRTLFNMADRHFGGTQAEGKYTPKDAYDALEAAINLRILRSPALFSPAVAEDDAQRTVAALTRLLEKVPTQTKRTAEQDQMQQFSTVPPLAFVANWVAGVRPTDVMLEPSAGLGGLAVFSRLAGAKVVLNEFSARRAALLQQVLPDARVFHEDAEHLHNILPDDVRPTVVVMNPPFSNSLGGVKDTMVGARHVEQALLRLPAGGRLVAIVGEGMGMDKPAFRDWWKKIGAKYDVRAAVPMDGSGYAKYGTTFDNVILVIDKVAPSGKKPVTTKATEYTELVHLLAEVRNGRPEHELPVTDHSAEPDPRGGTGRDAAEGDGVRPDAGQAEPGAAAGLGAGEPGGGSPLGRGGQPSNRPGRGKRSRGDAGGDQPGGVAAGQDANGSGRNDAAVGGRPDPAGDQSGVTVGSSTVAAGELTDSVFEGYQPQRLQVPGAKAHPGPLVQSAAMASVLPPVPTYTPNLPAETIQKGLVSIAQIEAVVYAGQSHQQLLETKVGDTEARDFGLKAGTPYRRGFFIGDGTGVGKGREISAILLDNIRQGRKKHVWVSEKQGLMNDAARDFAGIQEGVTAESVLKSKGIFNLGDTKAAGSVSQAEGILFTTYATLRSEAKNGLPGGFNKGDPVVLADGRTGTLASINANGRTAKVEIGGGASSFNFAVIASIGGNRGWQAAVAAAAKPKTRVDQIVEWLGPDFDGVIAFDEAHNAGNAVPIKGSRGASEPSDQALAVVDLQRRLPGARVVYVSATGATEVSNLSFANRLGIWGPSTPFASVSEFISQMTAGGLATMELVARDLKQTGAYMARSLSYDGVNYSRIDHELNPLQHDIYNRLTDAWQVVLNNIEEALKAIGATGESGKTKNSKAKSNAMSAFWGAQQRFFNQIITSMQMPSVIEAVEADIARGDAVVLQLVNTNEAQQERATAKRQKDGEETDLEDLDLTPRDQLIDMVRKSFPVQQYQDVVDEEGNRKTVPVLDSKGDPVLNKAAVAMRDKLIEDLQQISVPDGPLEILINHFGPEIVAEVTGRKQRVVAGRWNKHHKGDEPKAFIDKRGGAAARADADAFMADKKRVLIFSDAGGTGFSFQADLTKANQRKRQHYLVQPGWRANKAVQGLGRTHRTNQASAPHYKLVATNIPAHKRFLSSIARRLDQLGALTKGQRDTSSGGLFSEKDNLESKYAERAVRAFLFDAKAGQIEGLDFNDLLQQLGLKDMVNKDTRQITEAKIPEVRQFLNRLLSLKLETQELVFNGFISRMEEIIEQAAERGELDTGMQTIRALESKVTHEEIVFTEERTGAQTAYVELELTHPTRIHLFPEAKSQGAKIEWIVNAQSGRVWGRVRSGNQTLKNGAVVERYRMLGTGGMAFRTEEDFRNKEAWKTITEDQARLKWDQENAKKPPTYTTKTHMIVGAMLPIWDRLKTEGTMQVARTQTNDGRRLLGRVIHESDVAELRKRLNIAAPESKLPPAEVLARVLKGETAELANGWKLERARVSDDLRVEIKGLPSNVGPALRRELLDAGVIEERISWNTRYFMPVNKPEALAAITKSRPVVGLAKTDAPKLKQGAAGHGVPVNELSQMVARVAADWAGVDTFVVPSVWQLPAGIRASLQSMGAIDSTRGLVMPDGRVYLVADKLASLDEAQGILFHEVYGHIGMRAFLGDEYAAQMQLLRMANPTLAAEANAWYANYARGQIAARVKNGMTREAAEAEVRLLAVEEALADRAGDAPPPSGWKSLMAKLQQVLRRMGLDWVADKLERMTEAETHALLMNARRAVKRTGGPAHVMTGLPVTMQQPKRAAEAPIWTSALLAEVSKAPMKAGDAAAWGQYLDAMVKRGAVKADEIEWTGLRDFLALQQGRVTRDQIALFLADNGVKVTETVLGSPDYSEVEAWWGDEGGANEETPFGDLSAQEQADAAARYADEVGQYSEGDRQTPKYAQYTLPGGTNYREVLLTLPVATPKVYRVSAAGGAVAELPDVADFATREEAQAELDRRQSAQPRLHHSMMEFDRLTRDGGPYRSGHWDQPNVLAHIRLNDRTDADGRCVLFVEEIQSDWGQKAKKDGSYDPAKPWHLIDARQAAGNLGEFATEQEAKQAGAKLGLPSFDWLDMRKEGTPRAPFIGKTDAWVALAIKRVISIAAREGYDRVAFVNGEQSAERYDLSKQVDALRLDGDWDQSIEVSAAKPGQGFEHITSTTKDKLPDVIGKELAQRALETGQREFKGLGLKVGGEGMKAFYDKIVPAVAKDVLRKVGGGQITQIPLVKPTKAFPEGVQQPGFDVTPAMRQRAGGGLPLFSQAIDTKEQAFRQWFGDSQITYPDGKPRVMYHGTGADIYEFRGKQAGAIFLTDEPIVSHAYSDTSAKWLQDRGQDGAARVMPLYVRALNPFDYENPAHVDALVDKAFETIPTYTQGDGEQALMSGGERTLYSRDVLRFALTQGQWALIEDPKMQDAIKALGHDGFYVSEDGFKNLGVYQANQVKSAIGNRGTYDLGSDNILLSQGPVDPVLESAKRKAGLRGPRTLGDKVRAFYGRAMESVRSRQAIGENIRQEVFDQFYGILRAERQELGALPAEQSLYVTARLANGGTSSVMRGLMLHGQARWAGSQQHLEKVPGTRGLLDVLKPLGEDLNDFFGWMVGNRAARLLTEGRENNLTQDEIKALQGLANTPDKEIAFRRAALEYAAFKRSVLDVAQEAGLINPETRRVWDHADYIPFYREMDEKALMSPTGRKGLAGQSSGIRTLKGGESELNDPMENLLMNFSRLIDASLKNNAIKQTIEALGETDLVSKVGYDMKAAIIPRKQIVDELARVGTPESIIASLPDEVFEGMAKMWAIQAPSDPDVVRIMVGGKPQFYRVNDPMLLKALTSFVPFDFPGLAIARGAKRLLTEMVTSTPEFMIRNWVRDSMAAQAITETPFNPLESVKGIRRAYQESGGYEAMLFAGASFQSGHVNAADPQGTAVHMRRALRSRGFRAAAAQAGTWQATKDRTARAWEVYRQIGESIENANREAVYEAAVKAGKSVTEAAYEAKDLMDFSLRGSSAAYQLLADVLPFFNARVQGLYRLGRADRARLMKMGAIMAMATAMLALANGGEDWYEALPDWDKDTYWHFKIGGEHFRLPKPFELGVLFATLPERIGRGLMGLDSGKKTLGRVWANLRDQLAFDPVPQLIRPVVDVWANKDTFRDRPIEGMADEGLRPHARSDARTSDTTRLLAETAAPVADALELGPKKMEHLINGYLGTVGMYALSVSDAVIRQLEDKPDRPALRADDLPIIRTFYAVDPARATVFESDVYKMRKEVEAIMKEVMANATNPDPAKQQRSRELMVDEADKIKVRGIVSGSARELGSLNQQISRVYSDPKMTPDEKRAKVDELQQRKNAVARKAATDPKVREAF